MKKILFWILTFLWIWFSFCSAQLFEDEPESLTCGGASNCKLLTWHVEDLTNTTNMSYKYFLHLPTSSIPYYFTNYSTYWSYSFTYSCQLENVVGLNCWNVQLTSSYVYSNWSISSQYVAFNSDCYKSYSQWNSTFPFIFDVSFRYNTNYSAWYSFDWSCTIVVNDSNFVFPDESSNSCPDPEPSTINVLYNNENSTTNITCNWDNVIQIDWLSSITATNTFTPYFNINYRDEDNQLLTESYSKDILYLSWSLFKKTFTWDNDRILTSQSSSNDSSFTWYIPVFDVSWSTQPIDTEYNMFNNFADNSLKVLLSNIPWFFQYFIIFSIILLLIWIIKFFKKKR